MWYVVAGVVLVVIILIVVILSQRKGSDDILDQYINMEADVTETISNTLETGKVMIDGMVVSARKDGPGVIDTNSRVIIKGIKENSLIVKELN